VTTGGEITRRGDRLGSVLLHTLSNRPITILCAPPRGKVPITKTEMTGALVLFQSGWCFGFPNWVLLCSIHNSVYQTQHAVAASHILTHTFTDQIPDGRTAGFPAGDRSVASANPPHAALHAFPFPSPG